jgi:hypothetical protein
VEPQKPQEASQDEHRQNAGESHGTEHHGRVPTHLRVIVEAGQEDLIDNRANVALRCFDERQSQIVGGEIQAVEIPADRAIRREHDDPSRMGLFILIRVILILETDRAGQQIDLVLHAGEHVPAGFAA